MINELIEFLRKIIYDFIQGLPNPKTTLILFLLFSFWAVICAKIPSYYKTSRKIKTGYSRKIFHFIVFITVVVINIFWGFSGVCIFGMIISSFIFYSIYKKESSGLYLALARESDAPHSSLYIVIPFLSTLVGGLLINFFFPKYVALGYLICGIGDASGEIIGTRFGKHRFKVKYLNFHSSFKSFEGSFSVFFLSFIIYLVFTYNQIHFIDYKIFINIILSSFLITATEILSPKGFDNLSIQVVAPFAYITLIL